MGGEILLVVTGAEFINWNGFYCFRFVADALLQRAFAVGRLY